MNKLHYVLVLSLLAGCAELEPYTPKVNFQNLDVKSVDFTRADVDFVFAVDNPNPIKIDVAKFDYLLGFEGIELFDGSNGDGIQLDAVGTSELRLPVGFEWQEAWQTVQATRGEDYVDFFLDGSFGFDSPIGIIDIPYAEEGAFPAIRTPKLNFKKLRVTGFDGINADLKLDFDVDNEHASTLLFKNFDYDISLGGERVGQGLIAQFGSVEGATTKTMTVPLSINLLNVGTAVYNGLSGNGNMRVGLGATTDVETPFGLLPLSIDETGDVEVQQGN